MASIVKLPQHTLAHIVYKLLFTHPKNSLCSVSMSAYIYAHSCNVSDLRQTNVYIGILGLLWMPLFIGYHKHAAHGFFVDLYTEMSKAFFFYTPAKSTFTFGEPSGRGVGIKRRNSWCLMSHQWIHFWISEDLNVQRARRQYDICTIYIYIYRPTLFLLHYNILILIQFSETLRIVHCYSTHPSNHMWFT